MGKQRGRRAVNRVKKCEDTEMTQRGEIFYKIVFLLLCTLDLKKIVATSRKSMKYLVKLQAHKYKNKNAPSETISIHCRIAWTRSPSV